MPVTEPHDQLQLDAVRDPVGRLPLEISSEILVQCLPSRPTPGGQLIPMLFLSICNAWTDIALATPALWVSVHVDQPLTALARVLDTWLKRAGSHTLSLSLPSIVTGRGLIAVLRRHAHQFQDLKIVHEEYGVGLIEAAGPFISLKTLAMVGRPRSGEQSTRVTMGMLEVCPNLVECIFDGVFYSLPCGYAREPPVFPHLRRLKFGISCDDRLLQHISAPHLETLHVCLAARDLIQFLRRSSPPLRNLTSVANRAVGDSTEAKMHECLSLLPQLAHLELLAPEPAITDRLVALLAHSPHVIPELSSITLTRVCPSTPWYQHLVTALSLRREKIDSVRIVWINGRVNRPAHQTWAALRQLVSDGMRIHIGTKKLNYVPG